MSEMKTHKEIYDALVAAGAQTGDVVLTNKGSVRMLKIVDCDLLAPGHELVYQSAPTGNHTSEWPVCYRRPSVVPTVTVSGYRPVFEDSVVITYPAPPKPLTLEERVKQLEKDLVQYSDHMTRILNDHRKD